MTAASCRRLLASAFGAERVREQRAAGAADDVPGRRAGRLAARNAQQRRDRSRRSSWRARAGVPVTMLGGGSNVLVSDARRARPGDPAARRRRSSAIDDDARPRRRRRDDQRPGALDDQPRLRRPRGVGRHAGNGGRRDLRQRALRRPADRRSGRASVRSSSRGGAMSTCRRPTWRSATIAAVCRDTARYCCRRRFASSPGDPAALRATARESLAFRKRTQPLDTPSAGCIFQNPEPGRDRVPDGHPVVGRRARRSRRPERRARSAARACRRRTATSSSTTDRRPRRDIRQLIERCRAAVRDAVRRRPARGNRVSRRLGE